MSDDHYDEWSGYPTTRPVKGLWASMFGLHRIDWSEWADGVTKFYDGKTAYRIVHQVNGFGDERWVTEHHYTDGEFAAWFREYDKPGDGTFDTLDEAAQFLKTRMWGEWRNVS